MQTLEDWLPGRSPVKETEKMVKATEGSSGKMGQAEEDLVQESPQQCQQQTALMGMHHGQPRRRSQLPPKSNKRHLSCIQGQEEKSPENPYQGDTHRLLEAEGEQLSQPKRQKRITDYPQMVSQKPVERNRLDGEETAVDAKYLEAAEENHNPAEDPQEQDAKFGAETPPL